MNNGTYGLTKGQASPTSMAGFRGNIEEDLDPVLLALSIPGSTFIARGYSGQPAQLLNLTIAALKHTAAGYGMAYLEVLSPCVTYNDTYREWRTSVYNIDDDADYDRKDRVAAFTRMTELREQGRLPLGLIYQGERPALEKLVCNPAFDPPARQDILDPSLVDGYCEALQSFIK
jgi:2-oxoglutarate ferredoxin oxidoreductase subunit beta